MIPRRYACWGATTKKRLVVVFALCVAAVLVVASACLFIHQSATSANTDDGAVSPQARAAAAGGGGRVDNFAAATANTNENNNNNIIEEGATRLGRGAWAASILKVVRSSAVTDVAWKELGDREQGPVTVKVLTVGAAAAVVAHNVYSTPCGDAIPVTGALPVSFQAQSGQLYSLTPDKDDLMVVTTCGLTQARTSLSTLDPATCDYTKGTVEVHCGAQSGARVYITTKGVIVSVNAVGAQSTPVTIWSVRGSSSRLV
ncbi:hypothetical protein Pelo_5482 [Pelomyxa schiedti]|nr:hypothetical protein Pelo_5482 [Pelomyxa schiedti]